MPYSDPEKQRAAQARWYRKKYADDETFRLLEAIRKAEWLQTDDGKVSNAAASQRSRKRRAKKA